MAILGIRGTGNWGTDERPKNFRETILRRTPNGSAPLTALLSKLKSQPVDDPEFSWWEELQSIVRVRVDGTGASAASTTIGVTADGFTLVPGDLVMVEKADQVTYDNEMIEVSSVASDTSVVFKRGAAGTTAPVAGAAAGASPSAATRAASGRQVPLLACFVDSGGHHTQHVYTYARAHQHAHVHAIKGASIAGKAILGKPTDQDVNHRGQRVKRGVKLWPIGTDTAKGVIYGRLRLAEPGPGYVTISRRMDGDVFDQITSERLVTRYVKEIGRASCRERVSSPV